MPAKSSKPSPKKGPSPKQELAKSPPAEAAPAPKRTSRSLKKKPREIPQEEHHRVVAKEAYFIAERRGFSNGCCDEDWYEAERVVMQYLK